MKIAILSDIHGNVTALRAVLQAIEHDDVDDIYCLGDMFVPYPGALELWDLLKANDVKCVLGNNEAALLAQSAGARDYTADEVRFRPFLASAEEIRPILREVEEVPPARTLVVRDDLSLHFCHCSPGEVFRGLHSTFQFNLDEYVRQLAEPIVFTGHLHRFEARDLQGKIVYTVGSAGLPLKGTQQPEYALAEFGHGRMEISYRLVPYNVDEAVDCLLRQSFLSAGGPIAWLAFDEILTQRDRLVMFFKEFVPAHGDGPRDWYTLAEEFLRSIGRWDAVQAYLTE